MAAGAEYKKKQGRIERLESLILKVRALAASIYAILANRVQQTALSGAVVAAGGAITPDASITVKNTGKLRISANFSGVGGGGAGGIHAFLQVKIGAAAFANVYSWAPYATASHVDSSADFEFDTGAAPGTVVSVHWQTTAGDDAVTLGGVVGAGVLGASLFVQELAT